MSVYITNSADETIKLGRKIGEKIKNNTVIAYFGSMGMGKTQFTHGLADGMGIDSKNVSSPTFAIVHEYNGNGRTLYHFDMYRISGWDDLYSTGYFDYLDTDAVLAVEWSENIENALPEDCIKIYFSQGDEINQRKIEIIGDII